MDKIFKDWQLNRLATCCLIVIVWEAYDEAFGSGIFYSVKSSNIIFICFISVALFLLWLGICFGLGTLWLDKKDLVAVMYCVPAKSPAMGVPIASLIFKDLPASQQSKIQLPLVIFQGIQIAFGSVLITILRKWIDSSDKQPNEEGHNEEGAEPVSIQPQGMKPPEAVQ